MKNLRIFFLAILTTTTISSFSQYMHDNLKIMRNSAYSYDRVESASEYDISFTFKNLRLFPIVANQSFVAHHEKIGKLLLLDEAIRDKKIVISETGAQTFSGSDQTQNLNQNQRFQQGLSNTSDDDQPEINQQRIVQSNIGGGVSGTVNTLIAKNTSADTIFIMAGEVVKGGKQDRVIAKDVIIAPNEQIDLSAFCVEKNRWTTKEQNKGQFTGYFNVSSMDIRKAVTEQKSQHEVWEKVDEHTTKNKASSGTKAYTNLENSGEYQAELKAYMAKFKGAFSKHENVIGFVAVTSDRVIGCDLFATHDLFVDAYDNLIHSYIGHAITKGAELSITNEKVYAYLDEILKSEENQEETIENNGTLYKWKNKKLHITTY
jgi:hypothetical protein